MSARVHKKTTLLKQTRRPETTGSKSSLLDVVKSSVFVEYCDIEVSLCISDVVTPTFKTHIHY